MKRYKGFFKRIVRKNWGVDLSCETRCSFRHITFCLDWGVSKDESFPEYTMYLNLGFLFFSLWVWVGYYRMPK